MKSTRFAKRGLQNDHPHQHLLLQGVLREVPYRPQPHGQPYSLRYPGQPVCRTCRKGYGSMVDGLCTHCRGCTAWAPLPPAPPTTSAGSGKGIDMSCNLFPRFYDQLVDEDIEWLKTNAPDSLERDHILAVLEFSKREYRLRGYDEAMSKTGPHYQKDPS